MFGLCACPKRTHPCVRRKHLQINPPGDYGEYASDLDNPLAYKPLRPLLSIYALRLFRLFPSYTAFMRALHDLFIFDDHEQRRQYGECLEGAEDHHLFVQAFFSWAYQNPAHIDANDFGFAIAIAFKCGPVAPSTA